MRIPLRISVVLWAIILLILFGYSISRLLFFKSIFFAHAGIRLTQPQVATAAVESKEAGASQRVQHIPKIIHNVFHNWHNPGDDTLPKDMAEMRQTCIDTNPDFEFKVGCLRVLMGVNVNVDGRVCTDLRSALALDGKDVAGFH